VNGKKNERNAKKISPAVGEMLQSGLENISGKLKLMKVPSIPSPSSQPP